MADCKVDGCKITEWKAKSKMELKQKIRSNITKRGAKLAELINCRIKCIISGAVSTYSPDSLISISLLAIFSNVDKWKGVNISAMNKRPKTFRQYHKRADNYWNRYKAEWIGDHYFYPLLQSELYKYITHITTNQMEIEILYFEIFSNVMDAEIHYHRSKAQPLILDQSFIKSKNLDQLFHDIGRQNCMPWQVPINSNDSNGNYRVIVRSYVKQWILNILQQKQSAYNWLNINRPIPVHVPPIKLPYTHNSNNNHQSKYAQIPVPSTQSLPIRYHPYKIPPIPSPSLFAQCEIMVFDEQYSPPPIEVDSNTALSGYSYAAIHGPSFSYIYGNEDVESKGSLDLENPFDFDFDLELVDFDDDIFNDTQFLTI